MGTLIINRKKQYARYAPTIKVVIDNTQIIELANGETKKIDLPNGHHSIEFSYYCKPNFNVPFFKKFFTTLENLYETNLNHKEDFDLDENTEYTIAFGNVGFEILKDGLKVETEQHPGTMLRNQIMIKKGIPLMLFLYLPIILFNICIDVFSDFYTQAFSLLVYVFILLAPMFINYLKACLCDKEDVDKLQKIDDLLDKEWRLSLKALGVLTAGMLIVSLLFKNIVTSYAIISCIALLIAQILLSTQFISTPLLKLVGIIIVTSTLLSGCLAILPSGSSSCDHPACKENGPFPCMGKNNTCPNKTNCCYDYYCDDCE